MPYRNAAKGLVVGVMLAVALMARSAVGQQERVCLHGAGESDAQKARRVAALTMTRQINTLEFQEKLGGSKRFVPLEGLSLTAPVPQGFDTELLTNGDHYAFSVKDSTDSCRFAYFSDSFKDGIIYEGQAIR